MTDHTIDYSQSATQHPTRNLSHDVRTPLAVIRMQSQLMIRLARRGTFLDGRGQDRLMTGLQRIDDAVAKLNDALEQLEAGQRGLVPRCRDMH